MCDEFRLIMSNFIDDNSQSQNERRILTLFNFHTVFITNGEEFLRDSSNQVMILLDFEFSGAEIAFNSEGTMFGFHGEFLATQKIQFTARREMNGIQRVANQCFLTSLQQ